MNMHPSAHTDKVETMENDSKTAQGAGEAQSLRDFGALLLDTYDRLRAQEDKTELRNWLDWLHGLDREELAMALGKRELEKLRTRP